MLFFFFKQKTAYEMRISDWSSDVCSSDLHYNGYPTAEINGGPAPGFSSGQAQAAMEKLARDNLPNGVSFEWTELTYQQILAGNTAILVFPLCVLLVFLVLSSLYESWSLPLAVILIVPMVLLSAIAGVWLSGDRKSTRLNSSH